jgi:hypothetical protein
LSSLARIDRNAETLPRLRKAFQQLYDYLDKLETSTATAKPLTVLAFATAMPATDVSLNSIFSLTLAGNVTSWANPVNPINGQKVIWKIVQDGTGSRTVIWPTNFDWGVAGIPTLSTAANAIDYVGGIYDATNSKWDMLPSALGY